MHGLGCPTVRGCIVRCPNVNLPYYGALFVGDGVSLPIPPQFGCDECGLTHVTSYQNHKGGKSRGKTIMIKLVYDPLTVGHPIGLVGHTQWGGEVVLTCHSHKTVLSCIGLQEARKAVTRRSRCEM